MPTINLTPTVASFCSPVMPSTNFDGDPQGLLVGGGIYRGILVFDLSRLPSNLVIDGIALNLDLVASGSQLIDFWRIQPANNPIAYGQWNGYYSNGLNHWAGYQAGAFLGCSNPGIDYDGSSMAGQINTTGQSGIVSVPITSVQMNNMIQAGFAALLMVQDSSSASVDVFGNQASGSSVPTLAVTYHFAPNYAYKVTFMGQDITKYVISWGTIEQIKEVLLATNTILTSEQNLVVANIGNMFSPGGSFLVGLNWYNKPITITDAQYGVILYQGLVVDVKTDRSNMKATIVSNSVFKRPSEAIFSGTYNGVTPGAFLLSVLEETLTADEFDEYVNQNSFPSADGPSILAGATINVSYDSNGNTTVLQVMQAVGALCSMSFYIYNNQIFARTYKPFTGGGLKWPIVDRIVRDWGEFDWDNNSFNNQVNVGYPGGTYVGNDTVSQNINNVTRLFQFDGSGNVACPNLASAKFYGDLYLARSSTRRPILKLKGGLEFDYAHTGDRFPVTEATLGLVALPMELIECSRNLDERGYDLTLVGLNND